MINLSLKESSCEVMKMRLTSTETFKAKNALKKIAQRDRLKEVEKIA